MEKYMAFWKRGWWAWFFIFCANFSFGIFAFPLALALKGNEKLYWVSAIAVSIIVIIPIWGWLFERFASGSSRLISSDQRD
jgi:predicted permease